MKIKLCAELGCRNAQTTQSYCRLHYLKNWRKLKEAVKKKAADRLNKYVESICKQHPGNYVEAIKKDLKNEKAFERSLDDGVFRDEIDDILENMGYKDDTSLEHLIENLKIGDEFKK